jgi:ribulose kinase
MTRALVLDFGTSSVRAGVYDIGSRTMCASAEAPYATTYPRRGWAEQDPEEWWSALRIAARQVIAESGSRDISAMCVATTASTVVACTRAGMPLRPAILWMDCRAAAESQRTETITHEVLAYSGGGDAVEWLVPKAMWLATCEPATYREADIICEAVDFINYRLTGEWAGSRLNATCKWNYDALEKRYAPELFDAFGIPDLIEKLPAPIVPVGQPVGRLKREVADDFGIATQPLVAQGGIDAHIGVFGAGTVEPGAMLMIGGTSIVHLTQFMRKPTLSGIWGPYPNALLDGYWLVEGGQVSAGSILSWLTERIFGLDRAGQRALVESASLIDAGASGLLTLDYWMGNRTPYRDPDLRGSILGLSLWHDRATIYRSAIDAIALGSANVIGELAKGGVAITRLVLAGGICKNPLWLRATVDAIGQPIEVVEDENLSLIGGAVSAAVAIGSFPDLRAASRAFAVATRTIEPCVSAHRHFQELLPTYREATTTIAPIVHRLARMPAVAVT